MFIVLLLVTFGVAVSACFLVAKLFEKPIEAILNRLVTDELSLAWRRYITFAIYVVGISGGVRIWELEKFITPQLAEQTALSLNAERWTLEVYRTVISTLQSVAWMLLVFFIFALIAYVIMRGFEMRQEKATVTT